MSRKRVVMKLVASTDDQQRLQGILEQLRAQGVRISAANGALRKKDIVLVVLSEHFYGDETLRAQLFDLLAMGADHILPLNLGNVPVPEDIMNLLFARNIITPSDRDDVQVAERILSAIPEKKKRMPLILSVAAVMLVLAAGIFLWSSMKKPEAEPVMVEQEPIPNPWGMTEEELAKIQNVVIIGDYFAYHTDDHIREFAAWPDVYDFVYETWEEDTRHWYSKEDGHEYTMTKYDDLRFLELMPNLRRLRMVLVDAEPEMLPDLREAEYLNYVSIFDCNISDIEWVSAKYLMYADIASTNVEDYSPLSRCEILKYVTIDGHGKFNGDFSGFAPPELSELSLSNLQPGSIDLSALSGCERLIRLDLNSIQVNNVDFLEGMKSLNSLYLQNISSLRDISALSSLGNLRDLQIRRCDMISDYTPISSCSRLESFHVERDRWISVDSTFLNELVHLRDIGLFGLNLNNMDFLGKIKGSIGVNLGFAGDIQDYSGLATRDQYQYIHVNPRNNGTSYGDYALVAPYLENATINELELYNCTNVDLENLPKVNSRLSIIRGDLEDLSGLNSDTLYRLELRDMQYLRSLDGIEGLPRLYKSGMHLSIMGCIRLTDFDALKDAQIMGLNLVGLYSLPDFSKMTVNTLCLESIDGMEDLSCLESLNKDGHYQFKFLGMDELKDLSVLREYHGGWLYVPPQVADQAQELVDRGNFTGYEVSYPESGWNPLDEEVTLLSLEELETLPKAVLRRVTRVWIAGNEIIDPDRYEIREEWIDDTPIPVLYDRETGKTTRMETGSITDFDMLSDLTNIRDLRMFNQPLTDLEGIQYFTQLQFFDAGYCRNLTDVSALYTLQDIQELWLSNTGIDSIQGVQNLPRLRGLSVSRTNVSDLSPLAEKDYDELKEIGGFHLEIPHCNIADFSFLEAIPQYSFLCVYGHPVESWMEYVKQAEIRTIGGQMRDNDTLRYFVQDHPELKEMYIEEAYQLTSLIPLLDLENLEYVHIWSGPENAVRSLDGFDYGFRLDAN